MSIVYRFNRDFTVIILMQERLEQFKKILDSERRTKEEAVGKLKEGLHFKVT